MSSWLISSIISFVGVLISAAASVFAARLVSKREFKKLLLTWQREDLVSFDAAFSDMASAVSAYAVRGGLEQRWDAVPKIAALSCRASGPLAESLDALSRAACGSDLSAVRSALDHAMRCYRDHKQTGNHDQGQQVHP